MYTPSKEILYKYADLMVNFALRGGKGVKKGDTVFVYISECAKPFLIPLQETILKAGAHPIIKYLSDGTVKNFYQHASKEQLTFVPKNAKKGEIKDMVHYLRVLAEHDKHELKDIDPSKITTSIKAGKFIRELIDKKEIQDKLSRTICMYGTPAMAKEAGLSQKNYREQIIQACYLEEENPIQKWKEITQMQEKIKKHLNELKIQKVHLEGPDVDLQIQLGSDRQWVGGSGCNIPSFEIFTSPDRRGTEGWIRFNQPLYMYGQKIEEIQLWFKKGKVVKYDATENKKTLGELLKIKNANKLGEFSLTDARMSNITKFMAETLYDENVGGKYGNTHIAVGRSFFNECYQGDGKKFTKAQRNKIGFNSSVEHRDIVSTTDRTATACLADGSKKIIYQNGQFQLN